MNQRERDRQRTFDRAFNRAFGKALRELREKHGYSQEYVALELELDRSYLSGLERGMHNPSWKTTRRFCGLYGITIVKFAELVQAHWRNPRRGER